MAAKTEEKPIECNLFGKMAQVMGIVQRLNKAGHNKHFNYTYVTYDDIADMIRIALSEHGVMFMVNMGDISREPRGNMTLTTIDFDFMFVDGQTGEQHSSKWTAEATDNSDKGIGKCVTAGIKSFLKATFLISTGETEPDSEGEKIDPPETKQTRAKTDKPASGNGQSRKPLCTKTELIDVVAPMYDGNMHHLRASVDKLAGEGIVDFYKVLDANVKAILIHRAATDYDMDVEAIKAVLGVSQYDEWLKEHTHIEAWEKLTATYAANQEPAEPKQETLNPFSQQVANEASEADPKA